MIKCQTISSREIYDDTEFAKLRAAVKELFPLLHERAEIKYFSEDCWVYKIPGRDESRNILLMSHHDAAATGENAVCVGCRKADIIAGPVGIVIADALLGEITPKMAAAIGQSDAKRVLVPVNHCDNIVVGVGDIPMAKLVQSAVKEIGKGS